MEQREDAGPLTVLLPAMVGGVYGLPWTEAGGEITPRRASVGYPEDPIQYGPIRQWRRIAATPGCREQRGNLLPERIIELAGARRQPHGCCASEDWRLRAMTPLGMAAPGCCLMLAAKGRPPLADATPVRWFACCQQEPPHLGNGERD